MQAVIEKVGGVKAEDIQEHSWRSREDIVFATNAIFTKAFSHLPENQIALKPKRLKTANFPESKNKESEPIEVGDAVMHWHFNTDAEVKRMPGKPWMENCIAKSVSTMLELSLIHISEPTRPY